MVQLKSNYNDFYEKGNILCNISFDALLTLIEIWMFNILTSGYCILYTWVEKSV